MGLAVTLVPFADLALDQAATLARDLAPLGVSATVADPVPVPHAALNENRGQWRAEAFLHAVASMEGLTLGVTGLDLYVEGLNFVLGVAELPGHAAVISLRRLGLGADAGRLRERGVKEAVHELGHALGLRHCPDPRCVMHFSNSLSDTDRKASTFCPGCGGKLPPNRPFATGQGPVS